MKTILAAALLLCFIGVAAHASYNASYDKMASPDEVVEQCDALAMRLHNAVTFYLKKRLRTTDDSINVAASRHEAAQIATIFQAICKD